MIQFGVSRASRQVHRCNGQPRRSLGSASAHPLQHSHPASAAVELALRRVGTNAATTRVFFPCSLPLRAVRDLRAVLSHLTEQLCCSIRWVRARKQNNNILLTSFCVKTCLLHAVPYTLYHSLDDQRFIALGAATPSLTTSGLSLWGYPFPHLLPAAYRFGGSHPPPCITSGLSL